MARDMCRIIVFTHKHHTRENGGQIEGSCDGTGPERSGERQDLEKIVNTCITASLNGKALKPKSVEMQSLLLYL